MCYLANQEGYMLELINQPLTCIVLTYLGLLEALLDSLKACVAVVGEGGEGWSERSTALVRAKP